MTDHLPSPVGPLPRTYEPSPEHPPVFVALDRDLPKRLRDRLYEGALNLVFGSMFLAIPVTVIVGGIERDNTYQLSVGLVVLALLGLMVHRTVWRSRRSGIVVDGRGVHRFAGPDASWSVFSDEIAGLEPVEKAGAVHRAGVHSQRHFCLNRGSENVHLEFDTPMGSGRALIGLEDMAGFTAAVEAVRGREATAWRIASPDDPPVPAPARPDVDLSFANGELTVEPRFRFLPLPPVPLDDIREVRVSTDPVVSHELRARRSYNSAQGLAKPGIRRRSHPGQAWKLRWQGRPRAAGVVMLVLRSGGVVAIGTDHPDHVAARILTARRQPVRNR